MPRAALRTTTTSAGVRCERSGYIGGIGRFDVRLRVQQPAGPVEVHGQQAAGVVRTEGLEADVLSALEV